jgi:hypothetical protein
VLRTSSSRRSVARRAAQNADPRGEDDKFGQGLNLHFFIPVIYTCEKSAWTKAKTHFDTNHMVTILWGSADLKKAEDALVATIRATLRAEAKQTDE